MQTHGLVPIEWSGDVFQIIGAGEGNRTLVISLEGCCSTIELHPQPQLSTAAAHVRCSRYFSSGEYRIRTCEGIAIRFTVR